jgi:hypothetical protein
LALAVVEALLLEAEMLVQILYFHQQHLLVVDMVVEIIQMVEAVAPAVVVGNNN